MSEVRRLRASVVCYHCGHTSGEVEADEAAPLGTGVFAPTTGTAAVPLRGGRPRCMRCGGPTYYDDVKTIRLKSPTLITWRGRGRPPKNAIRISMPPEPGAKRRRPTVLYAVMVDGDPRLPTEVVERQAV